VILSNINTDSVQTTAICYGLNAVEQGQSNCSTAYTINYQPLARDSITPNLKLYNILYNLLYSMLYSDSSV